MIWFLEARAVQCIGQIAGVLGHLCREHLICYVVKPENILVSVHWEIKIANFKESVRVPEKCHIKYYKTLDYLLPKIVAARGPMVERCECDFSSCKATKRSFMPSISNT